MSGVHDDARTAITGVILCGGRGRRMGGVEKPLSLLNGVPLVQHVAQRLAPQVGRVIVSANREQARYAPWANAVVGDAYDDSGPLGGIQAALAITTTEFLFCCPGDAPLLDTTLVHRLRHAMAPSDIAVIPHDGTRAQPLFLLLRATPQVRASLDAYLQSGARAVHGWLAQCNAREVQADDIPESFTNINTVEALTDHTLLERL